MSWLTGKAMLNQGKASDGATEQAARKLLEKSNKKVPYEFGELQGSSGVKKYKSSVYIYYDTPYAVRLHEHPEYNFRGGRQGKWLERTMRDSIGEVLGWIADPWRSIFSRFT